MSAGSSQKMFVILLRTKIGFCYKNLTIFVFKKSLTNNTFFLEKKIRFSYLETKKE